MSAILCAGQQQVLADLQESIDSRLAMQQPLAMLSGRLDLLLAQTLTQKEPVVAGAFKVRYHLQIRMNDIWCTLQAKQNVLRYLVCTTRKSYDRYPLQ